jgi:hypothetical protein
MIDDRHLRHDRFDAAVNGRSINHGSARVAAAPNSDAIRIDAWQALKETHAVAEVLDLQGKELAPRFTLALAEASIVDGEPGGRYTSPAQLIPPLLNVTG